MEKENGATYTEDDFGTISGTNGYIDSKIIEE